MARQALQVFKFGGTSVASAEALRLALDRVREAAPRLVVVVSAAAGITDCLLDGARAAARPDEARAAEAARRFREQHEQLILQLIAGRPARARLGQALQRSAAELEAIFQSVSVLRELTPRTLDAVAARGERMLALLFAALLTERGIPASYLDAAGLILTVRRPEGHWPDLERSERAAQKRLLPLLAKGKVVVVPGFIGSGADGQVVTLGRGGSDFSATIVARIAGARSVTLFKDVDGLMTADPRVVPEARVLAQVHYREAAELAYYGAKVLHPRTMIPLVERGIPLFLRPSFNPGFAGTRINGEVAATGYPVKALTAVRAQALVSVEGNAMMGVPGIAARTFAALSAGGHSVSMISQASSESSICFVLPAEEADRAARALREAFASELAGRFIDAVRVEAGVALVAIVGLGMVGRPGIAARVTAPLARDKINIRAIAQGSSELNITLAIAEADLPAALRALHREFQLDKLRPLPETQGREASVAIFGLGQIGRALARQLIHQQRYFRDLGLGVRCVAVADRAGLKVSEQGFSDAALEELCARKEAGKPLGQRRRPPDAEARLEALDRGLFGLPLPRPVLVDATALDSAAIVERALERGFNVVLANKKPLTTGQDQFDRMMQRARDNGLALRYEATVGAGLPVLDTLKKLAEAGDRIETVLGCLSGTLGYLTSQLDQGIGFAEAVRAAHRLGYTEPDPKEDLAGTDVARKALILARTIGWRLELADIAVEALFPPELAGLPAAEFLARAGELDAGFAARLRAARRRKEVLRYVARIGPDGVRVGLESVPEGSPMGQLRGPDNQIVLYTARYRQNPLVVTGPGAGAEVTAAGVLNDVLAIASGQAGRP